jgi:hypothetical protein
MINLKFPAQETNPLIAQRLESLLDQFCDLASNRLKNSVHATEFATLFDGSADQSQPKYHETFVIAHEGQAPRSASEWEMVNQQKLSESAFIESDIQEARQDWLKVMDTARGIPHDQREGYIRDQRKLHFDQYPRIRELQAFVDRKENRDVNAITALMSVLPYSAYNLRQYAIEQGVQYNEIFADKLTPARITFAKRTDYSGECFAKKREQHGLLSNSDLFMWVGEKQSPLIQLYTIGHELIHAAQIKELMNQERIALEKGSLEFSRFLNTYGNYLSLAANTVEHYQLNLVENRRPIYGLADRIVSQFFTPVIQDVRQGLAKGSDVYHQKISKYGSLFGYMMPVGNAVRVKALREVVPALENAKNILFAKECGLDIDLDEVRSALPTANRNQVKRYRSLITEAARSWKLDFEALRVIASHQYYGVMFARADDETENLTLVTDPGTIYLSTGYNQTQQQQQ